MESQLPRTKNNLRTLLENVTLERGGNLKEENTYLKDFREFSSMYSRLEKNVETKKNDLSNANKEANKKECDARLNKFITENSSDTAFVATQNIDSFDSPTPNGLEYEVKIEQFRKTLVALNVPKLNEPSELDPEIWQNIKHEKVKTIQ